MSKGLVLIAAVAADGAIGKRGQLLWHLPGDLKHFKMLTAGNPVVMGRKTWESLPRRPLPGRQNIVISRNAAYEAPEAEVVSSIDHALEAADGEQVFVIGGATLYEATIAQADRLEITAIEAVDPEADTYFPTIDADQWQLVSSTSADSHEENGIIYRFLTYTRF